MGDLHTKICDDQSSGPTDMIADRQDTQTSTQADCNTLCTLLQQSKNVKYVMARHKKIQMY